MIKRIQIIFLAVFTLNLLHAQKTIDGIFEDIKFIDYELDLWTFVLSKNTVIDTIQFSITSNRNEAVKGFLGRNLRNVEFLPEKVGENFPNLAIYDVQNCSVKSIGQKNFNGLQKLVKLMLDYNELTEIDGDVFNDLNRLRHLSLTFNKIHTIAGTAFQNLQSLHTLYLGHNQLKYLNKNVFENLLDLRNLSLNYNHLTFLSDEHLMSNEKLEYLWLEHNDMSHLSYTMFNYMDNLKFIDFTFNLHMWSGFVYEKN